MCKCQLWLEIAQVRYSTAEHVFFRVLLWKIRFVQLSTLNLNCTKAMFHHKTPLFECFAIENPISARVNSDLKLYKCDIPSQNTSFCAFCSGKSASYKCQLWLEIAQMQKIYRKICLFEFCTVENSICATVNSDIKLHKCNIPLQRSFWKLWNLKFDLCKC